MFGDIINHIDNSENEKIKQKKKGANATYQPATRCLNKIV